MSTEPWQWPEETWRTMVNRARAGRSLKPAAWPQGARCAVAISFDADHETIPLRDNDPSPMRISQGQYGGRQAMPRIRKLLERESVPATFFYPAVSALIHPDEVRAVAADGHEIGIHSWIHEVNTSLPREAERELTLRSRETLAKISGTEPVGMRTASWDFSVNTLDIIREMKLLYDSSLMADDDPYELEDQGEATGIVELPPEWIRDDAVYFNMLRFSGLRPYTPPSAVEEIFTAEFDGAWDEGGMFLLTMHPHITGHRSRLPLLERLIHHMKAKGGCWFATHAQIAAWCGEGALTNGSSSAMSTRIGIAGITGRMGQLLTEEVAAAGATLTGGTSRTNPDLAAIAGSSAVVIDFTNAATAQANARVMAESGKAWILGTSGLSAADEAAVEAAAKRIPVVYAANFSAGVNLVLALAERMGAALPADAYDAEIVEMHHRQKVDAPSGTAVGMGRAVAKGRGVILDDVMESGRHGNTGARKTGAIGFAALRGGQVVGEHSLIFAAGSEHIVLTHRAFDRRTFATGAVRAALWAVSQPPRLYSMMDVLGMT